jgi:biopolymer transport protein TolR
VPVFVAGDGNAPYQKVYDVLTLLQTEAHVPRAGLMSQPAGTAAK